MIVNLQDLLSRRSQFRIGFSLEAICFDTYKFLQSFMAFQFNGVGLNQKIGIMAIGIAYCSISQPKR